MGNRTRWRLMVKSLFPEMDPYLEKHWRDVHSRLVIYACDTLQSRLPTGLRARVEERVFVESPDDESRSFYPDVRVIERKPGRSAPESGVAMAEPIVVRLP